MEKKEIERRYVIGEIKSSLKEINTYLVYYGPDKELERIRNYLFNKLWKHKGEHKCI